MNNIPGDNDFNLNGNLDKYLELLNLCKEVPVFEFDGVIFLGDYVLAVKKYIDRKPTEKFYIWLCDNYTQLISLKDGKD